MKIAVISDVHEDVVSLELAFRRIEKQNADQVVCLGDICGFSVPYYHHQHTRNAHECIRLIRKYCKIVIPGNHDYHACGRIPEMPHHFNLPDNWYELDYYQKLEASEHKLWMYDENDLNPLLTHEDVAYLKTLPEKELLACDDETILFTHYVVPNSSGMSREFYREPKEFEVHFELMKENGANIAITGHGHSPGLIFYTNEQTNIFGFRKRSIPYMPSCVIAPSVTKGGDPNGFLIIDTLNKEMEAIKIF